MAPIKPPRRCFFKPPPSVDYQRRLSGVPSTTFAAAPRYRLPPHCTATSPQPSLSLTLHAGAVASPLRCPGDLMISLRCPGDPLMSLRPPPVLLTSSWPSCVLPTSSRHPGYCQQYQSVNSINRSILLTCRWSHSPLGQPSDNVGTIACPPDATVPPRVLPRSPGPSGQPPTVSIDQ